MSSYLHNRFMLFPQAIIRGNTVTYYEACQTEISTIMSSSHGSPKVNSYYGYE